MTRKKADTLRFGSALIFVALGIGVGWLFFADKDSYGMNLWTEAASVVFTFLILDWWTQRRDERLTREREKARLTRQMGSRINSEAIRAVEELTANRWVHDGSLRSLHLDEADLHGANLQYADLYDVQLLSTNLREANLSGANLEQARCFHSDLSGAMLQDANLREAKLLYSCLRGAQLSGADLRGADLTESDLRLAVLHGTNFTRSKNDPEKWEPKEVVTCFDERTILPDGSKWTPATDMNRFIDLDHPNFWQSKWGSSLGISHKRNVR